MKYAVRVTESLSRTIIVEAESYEQAEAKVRFAYDTSKIMLQANDSTVDVDYEDDTKNYIDMFDEDGFDNMEVDIQ